MFIFINMSNPNSLHILIIYDIIMTKIDKYNILALNRNFNKSNMVGNSHHKKARLGSNFKYFNYILFINFNQYYLPLISL